MVSQVTNVVFGNNKNVLVAARYPTARLQTYSRSAETKLNTMDSGSSTGSEHSSTTNADFIRYDTAEGILPHPVNGYQVSYKGHKQLTVNLDQRLHGGQLSFGGLIRVHEALLLLQPKDHLARQSHIRDAIMKHTSTTVLTPDQLYKVAKIFSNATTADVKLVNYAANKTVDFMEAGIEDGSMSLEAYNALKEVSEAVPSLKQKMVNAYEGKKARKEREEARRVQALRWQAEREARNCQRAVGKRTFKSKKAKKWEELQEATEGLRPISLDLAKQLMTGPVVFKGEIAKAI